MDDQNIDWITTRPCPRGHAMMERQPSPTESQGGYIIPSVEIKGDATIEPSRRAGFTVQLWRCPLCFAVEMTDFPYDVIEGEIVLPEPGAAP